MNEIASPNGYALPVGCIPYASLNESQTISYISEAAKEMAAQGMHIEGNYIVACTLAITNIIVYIGFVNNGEYNVFRYKEYTHPLSIF